MIETFTRPRVLALFVALMSFAALAFAWTAQYGFNYQPCPLCMYQRKPYMAVIALGLVAALIAKDRPKASLVLLFVSGLVFLAGTGIAGFHIGVEQGWWKGLEACGDATLPEHATLEEMKAYLSNRPIIDCRIPGWKFLGLSMTTYNFMLSLALADFTLLMSALGLTKINKRVD